MMIKLWSSKKNRERSEEGKLRSDYTNSANQATKLFAYSTFDHLMEGCQILDFDWKYLYINETARKHNRCPSETLIGNRYMDMWPGIEETEVFKIIGNCLKNRNYSKFENHFVFPDGTDGWFDLSIQPIPEGVIILSIDCTDRKKATLKLLENEARLSVIFYNNPFGIVFSKLKDGIIVDVNDAFAGMHGYARDEMVGKNINELKIWANPSEREKTIALIKEQGGCRNLDIKTRKKDGSLIDILMSVQLKIIAAEEYTIGMAQDITKLKVTEADLLKTLKKYDLIAENSADVIWTLDLNSRQFTYISPSVYQLRGLTVEEVMALPMEASMTKESYQLVASTLPGRIAAFYAGDLKARTMITEIDQVHKTGKIIPTEVVTTLVTDKDGEITEILGVSRDITKRKKIENQLKESEYKFRKIYEEGPYGMVMVNREFRFLSANATFCSMVGYSEEELKTLSFPDITDPDDAPINVANIQKLIKGEIPVYKTEKKYLKKNGEKIWSAITVTANYDQNDFLYNVAIIEDITQRKQSEEYIRKISERHGLAIKAAKMGIWDWNILSDNLEWDDQMYVLYGLKKDDFTNVYHAWLNGIHPDDKEKSNEMTWQAINDQQPYETEFRVVWPDNSIHWLKANGQVFYDDEQMPVRMLGVNYDITDQKLAAEELQNSKTKLEAALDSMSDAVFISDISGNFIEFNEAFATFHKFKSKEECARTFSEYPAFLEVYLANGDLAQINQWAVPRALRGEKVANEEYILKRKDTNERWFGSYSFSPVRDPFGKIAGSVVVARDVTSQKLAEEAKKEIEIKFSAIFHASPIAFAIYALDAKFVEVNSAYCKLSGYSYEELIGKSTIELNMITSADRQRMMRDINQADGSLDNFEVDMYRKDGSVCSLLVSSKLISIDGKPYRLGINVDITARKQTELLLKEKTKEIESQNEEYQQLNEELVQTNQELEEAKDRAEKSDKLKTAFLQNMSHEIRTPMNAIMGFTELLVKNFNDQQKLERYSEIIQQRCNDLLEIITEVLDVAKIESGSLSMNIEECKLSSIFQDISLFFKEYQKRQKKQNLNFRLNLPESLSEFSFQTDRVKLNQILINLIGNAFKFTEIGDIEVGCSIEHKKSLLFYVSDTGIGIPIEKQDFIFERFAQLEATPNHLYGGTGLGLSIVKSLVELLGGKIRVASEPQKGSTFYFSVPFNTSMEMINEDDLMDQQECFNFKNKTLLIVEDDQFNIDFLIETLDGTGIQIIHTYYGKEAIRLSKTQKIDLILMDIRLPDIDGYVATQQIKKILPNIKVIAQTAYAAPEDKEKAIASGCVDYISKPIKQQLLLEMMQKQLAE